MKIKLTENQVLEIFDMQCFHVEKEKSKTADYAFERKFSFGKKYRIGLCVDWVNFENRVSLLFNENPDKFDKLLFTGIPNNALKHIEKYDILNGSKIERLSAGHLKNMEEDAFWDIKYSKMGKNKDGNSLMIFNNLEIISKIASERFLENDDFIWTLNHIQFEEFIFELMKGIGFKVDITPQQKDGGKDIICKLQDGKTVFFIELKLWKSQKVGSNIVEKLEKVLKSEEEKNSNLNYKGLIISPLGFADKIKISHEFEEKISFGDKNIVRKLCKRYLKKKRGLYLPNKNFEDILMKKKKNTTTNKND